MGADIKALKISLKKAIKASPDLNQKIVAEKVGISQPYLNEILNNNKPGTFELLIDISDAIGVSIHELLAKAGTNQTYSKKIVPENKDEEQLLKYFRALDTSKKFLLLNIAADYYEYFKKFGGNDTDND